MIRSLAALCIFGALTAGCGSDSSSGGSGNGSFASQFCSKLSACSGSVPLCQGEISALVLSPSCQQMLEGLTCADFMAPTPPSWWQSCFPACSGTATACNGDDTITERVMGTTFVAQCTGICSGQSMTYTGTCSTSFSGKTSTMPVCWCM